MKSVGIFLGKLSFRVLTLVGVVPVARSRPVKFLWHSPPLSFSRMWLPVMVLMVVLGLTAIQQLPFFENARQLVLRKPDDYWSHLRLAEAAVLASDYALAAQELDEVDRLLAISGEEVVLGAADDMSQVQKLVFPESSLREEVASLEQVLIQKPNSRDIALRLALLYWRLGETEKAREYLEQAKSVDPNNAAVQAVAKVIEN